MASAPGRSSSGRRAPFRVDDAFSFDERDQLVRAEGDRRVGRKLRRREVEGLSRHRIADGRQRHDLPRIEACLDGLHVHATDRSRVSEVHAVHDAVGPRGDEVAGGHADARARHRRPGQSHGEVSLELHPVGARRLHGHLEGVAVRHTETIHDARLDPSALEAPVDLRPGTGDQHQADAQRVQQPDVVHESPKPLAEEGLAAEDHHEGASRMRRGCKARSAGRSGRRASSSTGPSGGSAGSFRSLMTQRSSGE